MKSSKPAQNHLLLNTASRGVPSMAYAKKARYRITDQNAVTMESLPDLAFPKDAEAGKSAAMRERIHSCQIRRIQSRTVAGYLVVPSIQSHST